MGVKEQFQHTGVIESLAFHPQADLLATGSHTPTDCRMRVFRVATGEVELEIQRPDASAATHIAFDPQGDIIASCSASVSVSSS